MTELMNIIVDDLAQRALRHSYSSGEFFDGSYPNEDFIITMGGAKTTGPIRDALERHWGRTEAQRFFHLKHIVYSQNFDLIWWDGVGKAMASYEKCSGSSSPSRYPGGADPIASNPYGKL